MLDVGGSTTLGICDACGWQVFEAGGHDHRARAASALSRHRTRAHQTRTTNSDDSLYHRVLAYIEEHGRTSIDDIADALEVDRGEVDWIAGYVARRRPDLPRAYRGARA